MRIHRISILIAVISLCGCTNQSTRNSQRCDYPDSVPATQEASVKPGINQPYFEDPSIPKWKGVLETESREVYRERQRIVDALDLKPGQHVADVGAGTGLFSVLLARAVGPTGQVTAEDIIPQFLEYVRDRATAEKISNIVTLQGAARSTSLSPNSCDLVFICDAYHHFEYPQDMLASIRAALKPKGRLAIVEFERLPGQSPDWVFEHVRCDRQTVIQEIQAAGFRPIEPAHPADFLHDNYLVVFRK